MTKKTVKAKTPAGSGMDMRKNKFKSKAFFLSLVAFLVLASPPSPARAAGETVLDVSRSSIVISATGATGYDPDGAAVAESSLNPNGYVITGATGSNSVTVSASTSVTLRGVGMNVYSNYGFTIASGADVLMTLEGINTLDSSNSNTAGLKVPFGASVSIGGEGTLNAYGGTSSAGIGGNGNADVGTITIRGGVINAFGGGLNGAGIGGGAGSGVINISGGTVNATADYELGLGIDGSTITISGGTVNATGGDGRAAIGGKAGGSVTINGGTVSAIGGGGAAGIGVSISSYSRYDVTINGGTVTAKGGEDSAGIGGGIKSSFGDITINGGTVIATAGSGTGAGIGGSYGVGGNIDITGGLVFAERGDSASANKDISTAGTVSISGDAAVFLRTGTSDVSAAAQHTYLHSMSFEQAGGYGLALPASWSGATEIGAYLKLYTITFSANGESGTPEPKVQHTGTTMTIPQAVNLTGYTFDCWATTVSGGTLYDPGDLYTITGNATLYAHGTPILYSVGYDLDGGEAHGNPADYTIEDTPFTLENPTRSGYLFAGWVGTGIDGIAMSVTIPAGSVGDRSYTAHWVEAPIIPPGQVIVDTGYGGGITGSGPYSVTAIGGYVIDRLKVDGVLVSAASGQTSYTVDSAEKSIFATFAYTVNFPEPAHGTLAVASAGSPISSGQIIRGGQVLKITATPQAGYVLKSLTVNGVNVTAQYSGSYTYTVGTLGAYRAIGGGKQTGTQGAQIAASFVPLPAIVSVTLPVAINGVANGTAKTAAALGLPAHVTLVTDDGNVQADVTWDVASSSYKPSVKTKQTFMVNGIIAMPSGVVNPNGVSLNVSVTVSVLAAAVATPTPSTMPTPTAVPSPSASPYASGVPTPEASLTISPETIRKDEETGMIVVEIDVDALPEGTMAIRLPDGEVVGIKDAVNGKIRLEIDEADLNADGELEITVLNDEGIALGTYNIPVMDGEGQILIPDTGYAENGNSIWLWVLVGVAVLVLGMLTVFMLLKKKKVI